MARLALLALCLIVAMPAAPVHAWWWSGWRTDTLVALLSGAASVPSPTDTNATGVAVLTVDSKKGVAKCLSYQITVSGLTGLFPPLFQHIHSGNSTSTGPVVLVFPGTWTAVPGVPGVISLEGKITNTTLLQVFTDILKFPLNYYVNVHTPSYPSGAVRGQIFYNADVVFPQ